MCFGTHLRRNQTHNNTSDAISDPTLAQILSVDREWHLAPNSYPHAPARSMSRTKNLYNSKDITDNIYKNHILVYMNEHLFIKLKTVGHPYIS